MRASCTPCRRAAATVELSVCLPVLAMIVVGAIETSNIIYRREATQVMAYEAARMVAKSGKTDKAKERVYQVMASRGMDESEVEISFEPIALQALQPGEYFQVTVTVPIHGSGLINGVLGGRRVGSRVNFVRE